MLALAEDETHDYINKEDVLHVRLTELHAAHQNMPPAIRTLRLKEWKPYEIYTINEP